MRSKTASKSAPRRPRAALPFGLVLAAAFVASGAAAQRSSPGLAQSLFDEGRRFMKAGHYEDACPKFAESERLDPALGTLMNLALCHELSGRLATAWTEFRDAEAVAKREGNAGRAGYARRHVDKLEPKLARLTIAVAAAARANGRIQVSLDGAALGDGAIGSSLPVDAGPHRVDARADGMRPWVADVRLANGERVQVDVPALAALPLASPAAKVERRDSSRRTAGFITAGAGVAALSVGALAGLRAVASWHRRNENCSGDVCSAAGVDADRITRTWALVTDVATIAGVVGVGVGAYLVLTSGARTASPVVGQSSPAPRVAPDVAPHVAIDVAPDIGASRAGLLVRGSW